MVDFSFKNYFMDQLLIVERTALDLLSRCQSLEELITQKAAVFGKTGSLAQLLAGVKALSDEDKRTLGKGINDLKKKLETAFDAREKELEIQAVRKRVEGEFEDVTAFFGKVRGDLTHPMRRVANDVIDTFISMGFSIFASPEATTEYANFDAVNVPAYHPARDMQDTFWLEGKGNVLATQTSCMQNEILRKNGPVVKAMVLGHVFRNEEIDARHEIMFDQVECIVTGEKIGLSHLKWTLATMLEKLFSKPVEIRMRPGYFPFVEPGVEVDFSCPFCSGNGCKICKGSGWIEFMGAGLVHPKVLQEAGIDSEKITGFAFGFGLTRLAMIRYMVDDIRHFASGNVEFLGQF